MHAANNRGVGGWDPSNNCLISSFLRMQATLDREQIPGVVNTQLVDPWVQTDAAARVAFPGIAVADEDRAAVRPPNPSLCVGNGYVLEASDMVGRSLLWGYSCRLLQTALHALRALSVHARCFACVVLHARTGALHADAHLGRTLRSDAPACLSLDCLLERTSTVAQSHRRTSARQEA